MFRKFSTECRPTLSSLRTKNYIAWQNSYIFASKLFIYLKFVFAKENLRSGIFLKN